jgi:hypothetical protein
MNYRGNVGLGNCTPTSCPKAGIKIHESDNNYRQSPFSNNYNYNYNYKKESQLEKPVDFHNTTLDSLDLDLEHYSLEDLYKLFNIPSFNLSEEILKTAKQIVLKMHPDKSKLDSKYFLFFSKAYKRLYGIYEFQNKSSIKQYKDTDFFDESNKHVLDNMFEKNKEFKEPKNFNKWFNDSFEKHRLENPIDQGYGDWLKSDDGFIDVNENVTKGNMNEIFEQKKKQIQAVSVYKGVTDNSLSSFGGSLLNNEDNFTTDSYTDLRQAYTETLIPVTQEDYNKMPKYRNLNDYKSQRDRVDVKPGNIEESERLLMQQKNEFDQQAAALAFKYAQESEKAMQKQQSFWGDIKQLTGW